MAGDYRVFPSGVADEDLRRAFGQAEGRGLLAAATAAARWLVSDLERTPMEIGESRDYLPHLRLHKRIAFARPISVRYAVHEDSRSCSSWNLA